MNFTRLFDIPRYQLEKYPQDDMLACKINGEWKKYSTQECIDIIDELARGLIALGVNPGDKIALISNNRPEWNFIDLALLEVGAINVPIYPTSSESDYKYIFNDASVIYAFVSDKDLFGRVDGIKSECKELKEIFAIDEFAGPRHWTALKNMGDMSHDPELRKRMDEIKEEELATIIYTSGTTGNPKGVMLSHKNIVANCTSLMSNLPINSNHICLSFLPLCHIFEKTVASVYMAVGASIYYAESIETIGDNLKEVKPHYFTSVPRLLEKVYDKIMAKGNALTGIKKALFFWAVNLGLKYPDNGRMSLGYKFKIGIARALIFKKWQEALGGRIEGIVTGAAALQPRLAKVFSAGGIKVREGYGQTEASPVISYNYFSEGDYLMGSVGVVIPGVEVKIAENGEILAKGDNVMMGYYNKPEITAETIDKDGWLHTGDVGEFVEGKFLKITDRIKELFKTSGGKYVAPQQVENKMKESPFIDQVLVIGENQKFVGGIIMPAMDYIKEWAKEKGHTINTFKDASESEELKKRMRIDIDELNASLNHVEQIKKFEIAPDEWGIDTGEMTPTLKLKRKVLLEKYKDLIEKIYNN